MKRKLPVGAVVFLLAVDIAVAVYQYSKNNGWID